MVGEGKQSICAFRAGTVRDIGDFSGNFTSWADVVTLDRNYRTIESILAAAARAASNVMRPTLGSWASAGTGPGGVAGNFLGR